VSDRIVDEVAHHSCKCLRIAGNSDGGDRDHHSQLSDGPNPVRFCRDDVVEIDIDLLEDMRILVYAGQEQQIVDQASHPPGLGQQGALDERPVQLLGSRLGEIEGGGNSRE